MRVVKVAALALEFGFIVGAFLIAGIQIGGWLDVQLSTRPIFLTAGVLLGLAASFSVFWRIFRWQAD